MRFGIFVFMLACSAQTKTTIEDNVSDSLADEDGDGYFNDEDCDDLDGQINPGAVELCDAIDNNCDGQVDEGVLSMFFQDSDGDGFGDPDVTEESCQPSDGFVAVGSDCNDEDDTSFPGAIEVCDEQDNDCDGVIDNGVEEIWYIDEDGDGFGAQPQESCGGADGLVAQDGDCDDLNPDIYPDAVELCDGIDNDCDESIDEDLGSIYYADVDGDGFGNPQEQYSLCAPEDGMVEQAGDCDDLDTNINPDAIEYCDYVDNNCDGAIDENTAQDAQDFAVDSDGDGYGHPTQTQRSCFLDSGLSSNNDDCDDTNSTISPASQEECDGIDNNCDGVIDESSAIDASSWYEDSDGDGFGNASAVTLACIVPSGSVADNTDCDDTNDSTFPGAAEVCDEVDNDCDQLIDSDDPNVSGEVTWYIDIDEDGYGSSGFDVTSCFAPVGYVGNDTDCSNTDAEVYPGAVEVCNSIDDDCDGSIDENVQTTYYQDSDNDGYGDITNTTLACSVPSGYATNSTDCDDSVGTTYPGATESCNSIDDDCDGSVDENVQTTYYLDNDNDGYGDITNTTLACSVPSGYAANGTDCNDSVGTMYPGATESCNSIDDDCDGSVDENVQTTYYRDIDGDGYGNSANTTLACSIPSGYAANSTDCEDSLGFVYPGAVEVCNSIDDDCDGSVDENVQTTYYLDNDNDGYGNSANTTLACSVPSGYATNSTDCDDSVGAVYPGATESCNSIDDDCDGSVDENVQTTYYLDNDDDGYGQSNSTTLSCSTPSGYANSSGDCNDGSSLIYPGATEFCNSIDDDCDGTVDEPDSQDASEWYLDADGDEFGDPTISQMACYEPSSYTDNDLDCDDDNTNINPDASEIYDLSDNDCDGQIDEDLWLGSGSDGDLNITTPTEFSTHVQPSRSYPEAVSYMVDSISSQGVVVSEDALGIAQGDEVLVINLQGTSAAYSNVGTYEFLRVDSVNGSSISFVTPIVETYGGTSNGNISSQKIIVQRVPQYQDVDISSVLSTEEFDGTAGGLIVFRATGVVDISSGGRITVDGAGYRGGATGAVYNCDAFQGESYAGLGAGQGNGSCNAYNESTGQWAPNFGGGGSHICGGGGNYGGGATGSISWNGGSATAAQAGVAYGVSDLSLIFFGSGGGGVWNGSPGNPGPGGDGGGIIYIGALSIVAVDASSISSQGASTPHWAIGQYTYGAGGGAGGSIYLEALSMSLSSSVVDISGGSGYTSVIRPGGHGGQGRAVY